MSVEISKEKKEKIPTIFIEVYDRRDSGFVRNNTEGTRFEERLDCPSMLIIPNISFRKKGGKNERIRYISGEDEISLEAQEKRGIKPNPSAKTDKIVITNGSMSIARDPENIGLFDFLTECFWNATNESRSDKTTPLFKVIDLVKIQEEKNEFEIAAHEARGFVYNLQSKKGGVWVYQEERIDALCELFAIFAELPSSKVEALAGLATLDPQSFMSKVTKFEQTVSILVAHALQLNVIKFDGNTVSYIGKNKIIKNLGAGEYKHDDKIEALAEYLRTKDGYNAMQELKAEVDVAKELKGSK